MVISRFSRKGEGSLDDLATWIDPLSAHANFSDVRGEKRAGPCDLETNEADVWPAKSTLDLVV
jgi:hypothetical protein